MNKLIFLFSILILITGCSLNKNSKFWTSSKDIKNDNSLGKKVFLKESSISKELNLGLKIKLNPNISKIDYNNYYNNVGRINFNKDLKKSSRFKFSKIKNFHQFEPTISSYNDNIIFFDSKGSILQFNSKSNLVWKKNYYSK